MTKKKLKQELQKAKIISYGFQPKFQDYGQPQYYLTLKIEVDDANVAIKWAQENYNKYGNLNFDPSQPSLEDDPDDL